MTLDPKTIALQGFLKTPLALAVQGLIDLLTEPEEEKTIFPFIPRRRKRGDTDNDVLLFVL